LCLQALGEKREFFFKRYDDKPLHRFPSHFWYPWISNFASGCFWCSKMARPNAARFHVMFSLPYRKTFLPSETLPIREKKW
jgi:hypothetical protein